VLTQALQDFEVIVVDDNSEDETSEVVRRFQDPRIRYFRNEQHLGQAAAVNQALRVARGAFIAILHADDAWCPDALLEWTEVLYRHPEAGYVHSAGYYIDENDQVVGLCRPFAEEHVWPGLEAFRHHILWNFVSTPSFALARKECYERIGGYDMGDSPDVDLIAWLSMELAGYAVAYTPKPLAYYRRHNQTLTASIRRTARAGLEHVLAVQKVLNLAIAREVLTTQQRQELWHLVIHHFVAFEVEESWHLLRMGCISDAWRHLCAMARIASFEKGRVILTVSGALARFGVQRWSSLRRRCSRTFKGKAI
jgi:glycosyltransferase involved in cell wall biosynthesis